MKVLISPDSYKDSLSAIKVANCIEQGILLANKSINITKVPIADGGEGTIDAFILGSDGHIIKTRAHGPLMKLLDTSYGVLGDNKTAVIEMAKISGLQLLEQVNRNPLFTTTYGVGELILDALNKGYRKLIIGIGGSATNDGGVGMAQALGATFYDKNQQPILQGGQYLLDIKSIDLSTINPAIRECEILVACDVSNPLYGKKGAAHVYAKQKGANDDEINILDNGLRHLADALQIETGFDYSHLKGAGAAGGLGFGLVTFLNATLKPGIDIIIKACNLEDKIKECDLLITGEGRTDEQTIYGKAPVGLAKIAKKYNKKVICISGSLGKGYEKVYDYGIDSVFSIIPDIIPLKKAIHDVKPNLINFTYSLFKSFID
ncbi:MAG: glycerate kinase [Clostridiales bacterium]|nr:glycerate kinase [Clostridiales bacterium]